MPIEPQSALMRASIKGATNATALYEGVWANDYD